MEQNNIKNEILDQINNVVEKYDNLRNIYFEDLNKFPFSEIERTITRFRALIERFCDKNSPYFKQMRLILGTDHHFDGEKIPLLLGVIRAFEDDVEAGYSRNLEEIIHGDIFSDFLEMSKYFLEEITRYKHFKDAAAIIAGSTLESHLRLLSQKNSIEVTFESNDKIKPKNADRLNNDLARNSVYTKIDQKLVLSWLEIRNNAAHGHYDKYTKELVKIMIMGIRDFLNRNPA